jgi:hypothetical protein
LCVRPVGRTSDTKITAQSERESETVIGSLKLQKCDWVNWGV